MNDHKSRSISALLPRVAAATGFTSSRLITSRLITSRFITSRAWAALVLCVAATMITSSTLQAQVEFRRGDVNRDGNISISDAVPLLNNVLQVEFTYPPLTCLDAADVNDDGVVNLTDAFALLSYLFQPASGITIPEPTNSAGLDPTLDSLADCGSSASPNPSGSDIPHLYLSRAGRGAPGFAAGEGVTSLTVPLFLDSQLEFEGYSVGFTYDTNQVSSADLDFSSSVAASFAADAMVAVNELPGQLYGWVVLEISPPYASSGFIDPGFGLSLVNVHLEFFEPLAAGTVVNLAFSAIGLGPTTIQNEVVGFGGNQLNATVHEISVQVLPQSQLFTRGDANADGSVDVADAITLVKHLFMGESVSCVDALDVNDDGAVQIADAIGLLNYAFLGSEIAPKAPFPYRGIDPTTEDSLEDCAQ